MDRSHGEDAGFQFERAYVELNEELQGCAKDRYELC